MRYILAIIGWIVFSCSEPKEVAGTSTDGESTIVGQVIDSSSSAGLFKSASSLYESTYEINNSVVQSNFSVELLVVSDSLALEVSSQVETDSEGYFSINVPEQGDYALRILKEGGSIGSFNWPLEVESDSLDIGSIGAFKSPILQMNIEQLPKACNEQAEIHVLGLDSTIILLPNVTLELSGLFPGNTTLVGICGEESYEWDVNIPSVCSTITIGKLNWVEDMSLPGNKPKLSNTGKKGTPVVIDKNCDDIKSLATN